MTQKFTGSITALITPFNGNKVDYDTFGKFIEWQIEQGTHGIVPCGTTGESPTLNHDDHNEVIAFAIKQAKGRIPVIAGTGSNSTEEAIDMSKTAEKAGADALLIVSPYYNKPSQEGLFQHFKAINDAVGIPIIIYNIPGRSVVDIQDATLIRMLELKNIKGMKDATGNLDRISNLRPYTSSDFCYLGGDDGLALAFNALGACGTISVSSNVAPKLCAELQNLSLAGDYKKALEIHDKLIPLHRTMFCETSPAPAKYAAKLLGFGNGEVRLPLVAASDSAKNQVEKALKGLKLI